MLVTQIVWELLRLSLCCLHVNYIHCYFKQIINKVSTEYAISQLPEFHQNFTGLSEDQAELDFVQEAQKLPEYGIHFYKVQAVSITYNTVLLKDSS